ncbi:MAG: response regulator [Patescibacteria group bacterium]|nr:response regulator [Patescibacteria group bacterium]
MINRSEHTVAVVKPRILLVDDDRAHVRGMGIRLRAAGYDVLTEYDGAAGVDAALAECPAAIVLDIEMPLMDGLAAIGELSRREQTRHIPVIIVSGCVQRRQAALEQGARYFLEKPCQGHLLIRAIESLVNYPSPAMEHPWPLENASRFPND